MLVLTPPLLCGLVPPSGKQRDAQDARNYIREMYKQKALNTESKDCKNIYPHFTCATDTNNIRMVFTDVKDTVLIKSLQEYGVLWAAHEAPVSANLINDFEGTHKGWLELFFFVHPLCFSLSFSPSFLIYLLLFVSSYWWIKTSACSYGMTHFPLIPTLTVTWLWKYEDIQLNRWQIISEF